jgi:hypothetical protein
VDGLDIFDGGFSDHREPIPVICDEFKRLVWMSPKKASLFLLDTKKGLMVTNPYLFTGA